MRPAKVHDRQFLLKLKLPRESFIVFDRAYNDYRQFHSWSKQQVWFVSRMKENAVYHVCKVLIGRTKKHKSRGVLKDQLITMGYKRDKRTSKQTSRLFSAFPEFSAQENI